MTEPTITCPSCRTDIRLTESLAAPLVAANRRQYERALAEKDRALADGEAAIRSERAILERERQALEVRVAERLATARTQIAAEETDRARRLSADDFDRKSREVVELQTLLRQRNEKLASAQQAEAGLIRKQRELDDARREMDLTIENKVQASLTAVREKAHREADEGLRLRVAEKEEQIASMQRQIEELRRKAEQGSQQLQGEVQELELEALLRHRFPHDLIEAVPKGDFGGDVLQRVVGPASQQCGTILWETKRTKNWSDGWLTKLRDDQRRAKAEVALIVSNALPKGLHTFDHIDGIWVAEPRCAIPVAIALRHSLIEITSARQASHGQQTKMELVYKYLTGPHFRQRIEAIVEKFSEMQEDLDRERKAMTRLWAKREGQIRGVIEATAGMYGDLQGIAGKALVEIDGISILMIEDEGPRNQKPLAA